MDLISLKNTDGKTTCFILCAAITALSALSPGCGGATIRGLGGIPTRVNTLCQVDEDASLELGTAQTPFTCRGTLASIKSAAIAVTRPADDQNFTVYHLNDNASINGEVATPHVQKPQIIEISDGFLLASLKEGQPLVTRYDMSLAEQPLDLPKSVDQPLPVLKLESSTSPPSGPAEVVMFTAATATQVTMWRMEVSTNRIISASPLHYPETEYCAELLVSSNDDGTWTLRMRCEEMLPAAPLLSDGVAKITAFDEESDDVPEYADVRLTLDPELLALEGSVEDVEENGAAAQPGYALKRFLDNELPRPVGYRVRILGTLPVGEAQALTLACQGNDASPAILFAATLTCQERP